MAVADNRHSSIYLGAALAIAGVMFVGSYAAELARERVATTAA